MSEEPCIAVENIQGSARIRPTGDFSVDPVGLERKALNDQFRLMRMSHESLQRSRGQLKRRTRELKEAQEVLVSTAARKLIPGATLNNSWVKDTIISMVTVMDLEMPTRHKSLALFPLDMSLTVQTVMMEMPTSIPMQVKFVMVLTTIVIHQSRLTSLMMMGMDMWNVHTLPVHGVGVLLS